MYAVADIAKWFLSKDSMTHKKLQKLCYYAQAWSCALFAGDRLFEDEIQAWVHGPVVPSLYRQFSKYGWKEIPKENCDYSLFSDDTLYVLNAVYNTYGEFTGDQLEWLACSEHPWKEARHQAYAWEVCTDPISCKTMRNYYAKKYEEAQND